MIDETRNHWSWIDRWLMNIEMSYMARDGKLISLYHMFSFFFCIDFCNRPTQNPLDTSFVLQKFLILSVLYDYSKQRKTLLEDRNTQSKNLLKRELRCALCTFCTSVHICAAQLQLQYVKNVATGIKSIFGYWLRTFVAKNSCSAINEVVLRN